ncbi:hypothetical protein ACEQ8H_007255 [Pleosporales sp. CAS-2024a]
MAGFYTSGALNVSVDVALMAIVRPRVMVLKLHNRQKWALVGVVLLGTLAVVAGIIRMVRVGQILEDTERFDPSWDAYDISIWTNVEIWVSILCAAAPGIKPVLLQFMPKLLGSTVRRSPSKTNFTPALSGPSIEMASKWKRSTTGSNGLAPSSHIALAAVQAPPCTECARGVDAESYIEDATEGGDDRKNRDEEGGIIYQTS